MSTEKRLTPMDEAKRGINLMGPQFKLALPAHVSPEKFIRTIITAIQMNPGLLECDRQSLYSSAMRAASAGLLPDGKEAALVPYSRQVQFLPMIGGILKQLRNTGEIAEIQSEPIFENDEFDFSVTSDGVKFMHRPNLFGDRGKQLGVYAFAKLKDGSIYVEVMNMKQIEDVRNVSKAKNGPAWSGPFADQMAKKTVIRRLAKRLPISTDKEAPALDAHNHEFQSFAGRDVSLPQEQAPETPKDVEAIEAPKKSELDQIVDEHKEDELELEKVEPKARPYPSGNVKNFAPGAENN